MITFFSTPKWFSGHTGVIQRNALQSWKRLDPDAEVIVMGDESGSAEVARELGLIHVPDIARNDYGSALLNDLFAHAHTRARHELLCYINADIILMKDFIDAARRLRDLHKPFLMCGRRWKLDVTEPLTFQPGWEEALRRDAIARGHLDDPICVDYFLFTRGLFGEIPPFAIGRRRWDRWLQYHARSGPGLYLDATEVVTAIHQNHDYGRVGFLGHKRGPETARNIALAGDQCSDLRDAGYKLTRSGVTRAIDSVRLQWRIRRMADTVARRMKRFETGISAKLGRRRTRRLVRTSHAVRRLLKSGSPFKKHKVAVVGLGKIGLPLAVCLAHKGCRVIGLDADKARVATIRSGRSPFDEKDLGQLLVRVGRRLTLEMDAEKAIFLADATFLVLPTQQADGGGFTPDHLLSACETIGRVMGHTKRYHLVVIVSTVLPGWTAGILRRTLERVSGRKAGPDFGLCYWPAFVALGKTVEGFLTPDFTLIGESDPVAGMRLERILAQRRDPRFPIVRTNFVNAELAKLALNTYVSTKISFANLLAQMCEPLPGANVDVVTSVLQLDRRVGRGYLTAGLSYGGPCFPNDVPAFAAVARQLGAPGALADATDVVNKEVIGRLFSLVQRTTPRDRTVGICGVSFKPDTGASDGSPGLLVAEQLEAAGYSVLVYDPQSKGHTGDWRKRFKAAASFEDCIRRSDTIVLALPDDEFSRIDPEFLQSHGVRRTVIDCWRILDPEKLADVVHYHALGLGPVQGYDDVQAFPPIVDGKGTMTIHPFVG
jgi:UDPglucose 6-dehydrogenase